MKSTEKVVCRFAPSPTGPLHVGGARSALFNYLFARQNGGKLILRIEDTDKERSKKEYEEDILDGFKWLGIEFDETHRQSDRTVMHQKYLKKLIDSGSAYLSKENHAEESHAQADASQRRAEVIRFKNPNRKVVFEDLIKGRIEFDTTELGDFVIAKSMEEPLFHLAVVVDDFLMGVTHVIRGEDHISNTPRQILIQEAIGAPTPKYGHIPLILAPDRSKLSKRKHGESVSLKYYREQGYLPEALLNFLAFLGWNPGDDREAMSIKELVKEFSLERVQTSSAIFNREKLNWLNKRYLLQRPHKEALNGIKNALSQNKTLNKLEKWQIERLSQLVLERIHYYGEATSLAKDGEFDYIVSTANYSKESLLWKKDPEASATKTHLEYIVSILKTLNANPEMTNVRENIYPYADQNGRGEVLWPLRYALSGRERSIDPFNLISILGTQESIKRLKLALDLLK